MAEVQPFSPQAHAHTEALLSSGEPPAILKKVPTHGRLKTSIVKKTAGVNDVSVRAEGIGKSAWQLEDTQQSRLVEEYPTNPVARECYFECADAEVSYRYALVLLLFMTAAETPSWCNTGKTVNNFFGVLDPHDQCTVHASYIANKTILVTGEAVPSDHVPLSNMLYIPFGWGIVLEVYLISVMARKLMLEWRLQTEFFDCVTVDKETSKGSGLFNRTTKNVQYFPKRTIYFGLLMVLIEMFDCIFFILYRPSWRLAFIPRTGYLCLLPAVRQLGGCVMRVWEDFVSIASFFVGALVFYAWVVATIFNDMDERIPWGEGKTIQVNHGMGTFMESFYTMFIAGTTEDFHKKFLPSYTAHRWTGFLWLFFLFFLQVLLLNLVLDTLVAAYGRYSEHEKEEFAAGKVGGIERAFKSLCETCGEGELQDNLSKTTFLDFCREFSRSPRTRPITNKTANYIWACVDRDRMIKHAGFKFEGTPLPVSKHNQLKMTEKKAGERYKLIDDCTGFAFEMSEHDKHEEGHGSEHEKHEEGKEEEEEEGPKMRVIWYGQDAKLVRDPEGKWSACCMRKANGLLDIHGFVDVCSVMQYDFWTVKTYSPLKLHCPDLWHDNFIFKKLIKWVMNDTFDMIMNCVLILNLILIIIETVNDLAHKDETPLMEGLELAFSIVYCFEIGIKLSVMSWGEYTSARSNMFDFVTTWLLLASSLVELYGGALGGIKRYMNILRLLRLVRMVKGLKNLPEVRFMLEMTAELIVRAKDILTFLGVVVFFFTTLSVQLWGGKIYVGNPSLAETEYKEANLWALNFNDFFSAFGVWVVSLLMEYNEAFPDAVIAVSSIHLYGYEITWWVFIVFYIFAVSIVFELVKAFTIEVFIDLRKQKEKQRKGLEPGKQEYLEKLREILAEDDYSLHVRMLGDDSAEELMAKKMEEMVGNREKEDDTNEEAHHHHH